MTVTASQLHSRVVARFPDAEQINDTVIRFTKKMEGNPYAVYYLDVAQNLPSSQEILTKYQDRIIGSHYFEGSKSLQWSNYLYFITSREQLKRGEVIDAKDLIERDRNYARKFVIPEDEIDQILKPPVIAPTELAPHEGILSIWASSLADAGLDAVIFSDNNLPARLKLIEKPSLLAKTKIETLEPGKDTGKLPFIRSLELKKYREFTSLRKFKFGKVNLIFGRNGSGKTSLLETIELFYCGRNKRNLDAGSAYSLGVTFVDGKTETATNSRNRELFRTRNLKWYGQPEVRTNNLCQSFSQFNFLNTDAAVGLADSRTNIEDDLSKLLVGSEASKVWRNIERVSDEIAKTLKGLNPLKTQIEGELNILKKSLSGSSDIRLESDSIRIRLKGMINRAGWREARKDEDAFAASLIEPLAELLSIVQQATRIDWTASPISIEAMATYCRDARLKADNAETSLTQFELLLKERVEVEGKINRDKQALIKVNQVKSFIAAGLLRLTEELNDKNARVATLSGWLVGIDAITLDAVPTTAYDSNISDFQQDVISKRSVAKNSLADSKKEYEEYSELREQSLNLAQQLREISEKILLGSPKPDECPLCHTQFESGELKKHINIGVDEHLEMAGQTLLKQLREREVALREISQIENATTALIAFCERKNHSADRSVRSIMADLKEADHELEESRNRFNALNDEIHSLQSQGLSLEKLDEITDSLRELGRPIKPRAEEEVNHLISTINEDVTTLSRTLEKHQIELDKLKRELSDSLGTDIEGQLKAKLSQLKERVAKTEAIQESLGRFSLLFPWPIVKPLAELVVEAESIRNVASELQSALNKEQQTKADYTESIRRKESLEKQHGDLLPGIERFSKAHSALRALQNNHSLNSAMESALQENRTAIEAIFSQIHAPAEFRGLGKNWTTLIRKVDESEAKLTEISTGQRAAFALSVFLAQNAKLTVAPPVILIDDPIAHVDDMNSLSFLDYLREVALQEQRQIFFATASDKLAALFQRKFDFLGEEGFRRLNLTRNV